MTNILLTGPSGFVNNLKLSPTVSNNDLVLTLLTKAGATPSATDPILVRIGNTDRYITAALSVTKADNTNWANLGSATLGTLEHDLFVYAVWNTALATPAVDAFWSRISYGRLYSDFSATTTAETYAAINATAPNATDECVVIGRFAATLSLTGTGHVWTVPTYTNINLIHAPVFESRILTFAPQWTNLTVGSGTVTAKYQVLHRKVEWLVQFVWAADTSASGLISHTIPMAQSASYVQANSTIGRADFVDSGAYVFGRVLLGGAGAAYRANNSAGTYTTETNTSATVPFTWATADEIHGYGNYFMA